MRVAIVLPGLIGKTSGALENIYQTARGIKGRVDIFVHTWRTPDNLKDLDIFYKKYRHKFNLHIITEDYNSIFRPLLDDLAPKEMNSEYGQIIAIKRFAIIYSMFRVVNMIPSLNDYDFIIRGFNNTNTFIAKIPSLTQKYFGPFHWNNVMNKPLLHRYTYKDCIYCIVGYKFFDQRLYFASPKVFKSLFIKPLTQYVEEFKFLNMKLVEETKMIQNGRDLL